MRTSRLLALLALASIHAAPLVAAPVEGNGEIVYATSSYRLERNRIVEGDDEAVAWKRNDWIGLKNARGEMVRPFLRRDTPSLESSMPLLDSLYHVAKADLEQNIVDDEYFRVSPDFHWRMFFTRDIAYSSMLGANYSFADVVKSHLRKCLEQRHSLGFRTARGHQIPIPAVAEREILEPLNNVQFWEKYATHPYARRTDDVCWVPGYWSAMEVDLRDGELAWFTEEFDRLDRDFYSLFLDPEDGLYFGQASFIDIGGTGYPESFGTTDSIMIKALSTNAVYLESFRILAEAHRILGNAGRQAEFEARAAALRESIRRDLLLPDGHLAYFKHRDGKLEPRREQLGSAFAVLFGVTAPGDHGAALADYPRNDFGNPLIHPFYPNEKVYHNNSIWPFANTFFNRAEHAATPTDEVVLRTLGNLSRHALQGNFAEVMDYATGGRGTLHARSYTWSAAALLSVVHHLLLGMEVEHFSSLRLSPHLPAEIGGRLRLSNLVLQGTRIEITLTGSGRSIASVELDGAVVDEARVPLDGGEHRIAITLAATDAP